MRRVRIPHDLNGDDQFVLGLSVTRLAALLFGLLAAYTILHLAWPTPLRMAAAAMAALIGAAIAWVRPEGRSLVHWMLAAIEFKVSNVKTAEAGLTSQTGPRLSLVRSSDQLGPPRASMSAGPSVNKPGLSHAVTPAEAVIDDDVIELPDRPVDAGEEADTAEIDDRSAPVYLGGPQVVCFFSPKGGTGRTTLATETAALLAKKGRYRSSADSPSEPLRVVLVDFDLGSANVSARLGLAQPTMLDYLCGVSVPSPDPGNYVVRHKPSNLDVLLGPSKCLAGDRAELLGVPQAAHILSALKSAGYHFLIVDMAASLGDLETYLLEAASRIYCVVTPTAGSVQSLYRGVEALRRLGLGSKLQYVANKMRDGFSLAEPMSDLNGTLVARIPYDAAFDGAENRHEPMVTQATGAAVDALGRLATSIYPALDVPLSGRPTLPPFAWFVRRRRAG
jgi:MinD-like ATPase involved in chromosome partitioning or flagellar assembly